MKDLRIRVTSGAIGLIILLSILYISNKLNNNILIDLSVTICSLIGLGELFRAYENKGLKPLTRPSYIIIIIGFLIRNLYKSKNTYTIDYSIIVLLFLTVVSMVLLLELLRQERNIEDVSVSLMGMLYLGFLFSHLGKMPEIKYVGLVFIIAFGTDTFAYFGGNFLGRNKLCPKLSPNKTIEGAVTGILGSVILTVIYLLILKVDNIYRFIPLAIISSIISQTGDLVASSIKRDCKIKDYGKLIPGHGGILDRFDSVIFTSPIIYYYVEFFINK